MSEDDAVIWQDVLEEILAGRGGALACPHCNHSPLKVDNTTELTKISCSGCEAFIQGRFGGLN